MHPVYPTSSRNVISTSSRHIHGTNIRVFPRTKNSTSSLWCTIWCYFCFLLIFLSFLFYLFDSFVLFGGRCWHEWMFSIFWVITCTNRMKVNTYWRNNNKCHVFATENSWARTLSHSHTHSLTHSKYKWFVIHRQGSLVFSVNEKFNGGKLGGAHETFVSARRETIQQHGLRVSFTDVMPCRCWTLLTQKQQCNIDRPSIGNWCRWFGIQVDGDDIPTEWISAFRFIESLTQLAMRLLEHIKCWHPIWTVFSSSIAGTYWILAIAIRRWRSNSTQNNIDRNGWILSFGQRSWHLARLMRKCRRRSCWRDKTAHEENY